MVESRASSHGWRDGRGRPSLRPQSAVYNRRCISAEDPMFQNDLLQPKRILITGGGTG